MGVGGGVGVGGDLRRGVLSAQEEAAFHVALLGNWLDDADGAETTRNKGGGHVTNVRANATRNSTSMKTTEMACV